MSQRQRRIHEIAADIVAECGPYARMAALFLASERDEEGDADGVVLWTRVANIVDAIGSQRRPPPRATLH
jgi:hypothetical protein